MICHLLELVRVLFPPVIDNSLNRRAICNLPMKRHSGNCSALAHIANSGIFPAQSLKQGNKCRNSTTSCAYLDFVMHAPPGTVHINKIAAASRQLDAASGHFAHALALEC
jgi:hypothetical protein